MIRIKLIGARKIEIVIHENDVDLIFKDILEIQDDTKVIGLYYEDVIKLATGLMRAAEEIK